MRAPARTLQMTSASSPLMAPTKASRLEMADPNEALCAKGQHYCKPWGRCAKPTEACPQSGYLPNVTQSPCIQASKVSCLSMPNSFEAAACLRAVEAPFQAPQALSREQLADMIYFPEGVLRGRIAGRRCLSGPGPAAW